MHLLDPKEDYLLPRWVKFTASGPLADRLLEESFKVTPAFLNWGLNPGPCTYQDNARPLSYRPSYSPSFSSFFWDNVFASLPRIAVNIWYYRLSLLSSWDSRLVLLRPAPAWLKSACVCWLVLLQTKFSHYVNKIQGQVLSMLLRQELLSVQSEGKEPIAITPWCSHKLQWEQAGDKGRWRVKMTVWSTEGKRACHW